MANNSSNTEEELNCPGSSTAKTIHQEQAENARPKRAASMFAESAINSYKRLFEPTQPSDKPLKKMKKSKGSKKSKAEPATDKPDRPMTCWQYFLSNFAKSHPEIRGTDLMKEASNSYKTLSVEDRNELTLEAIQAKEEKDQVLQVD